MTIIEDIRQRTKKGFEKRVNDLEARIYKAILNRADAGYNYYKENLDEHPMFDKVWEAVLKDFSKDGFKINIRITPDFDQYEIRISWAES